MKNIFAMILISLSFLVIIFGINIQRTMLGGWIFPLTFNATYNQMMNGGIFDFIVWIFMILWWVVIFLAIIALLKWFAGPDGKQDIK